MENITVGKILEQIEKSTYMLQVHEQEVVKVCRIVADTGADLPADESLQLENLFEKIKRGGYLRL